MKRFLWVYLQIEALWDKCFTDLAVRQALMNLPKDLEETYRRCLDRIDRQNQYAFKVLRWVNYAMRPLQIDELREAVAFDLQDKIWSSEKIPDPMFVIGCCANLVILDATDQCVRFAHSSVKSFLETFYSDEKMNSPACSTRGELECGELCVSYLSFSDFGLQVEQWSHEQRSRKVELHPNIMNDMIRNSFGAFASKFVKRSETQGIQMPLPTKPFGAAVPDQMQYKFLRYAAKSWARQTKMIDIHSVVWHSFCRLAMTPNETWGLHPWTHGGQSKGSYLHGIFGWAVREHHMPLLELIIESTNRDGLKDIFNIPLVGGSLPALHVASRLGYLDSVKCLLKVCIAWARDGEDRTALHHAAEKGNLDIVSLFLTFKWVKPYITSDIGETPLTLAVKNGHAEVVALLLELTTKKLPHKHIMLADAVAHGHEAIVKLLIIRGVPLDSKGEDGKSPLTIAAAAGNMTMARLLIQKGALLDQGDNENRTPLFWAAYHGHEAMTRLLSENSALY